MTPLPFDTSLIRALSFDCYGTLIDWQTGILTAVRPVLARHAIQLSDADIITRFAAAEREAESGPYISYKDVLRRVMSSLFSPASPSVPLSLCPSVPSADHDTLWESIRNWQAFPDTPSALHALNRRFRLAIISNIDNDLFDHTRPKLESAGARFDAVITAEQVRSYKPRRPHFDTLLARLQLQPHQILHIAESRYHDIEPASALGFPTVWLDRTRSGITASGPGVATPALTVRSLEDLAAALAPT